MGAPAIPLHRANGREKPLKDLIYTRRLDERKSTNCFQNHDFSAIPLDSPLRRRITSEEYNESIAIAKEEGITRLDKREKLHRVWF